MAYYLRKYKGKYRLLADIDETTNDFPRDENGKIEENDVYISCRKGRIYHFGRSTLVCYCPSIGIGRNVLKSLAGRIGVDVEDYFYQTVKGAKYNYDGFYEALEKSGYIFGIEETDTEISWKFDAKHTDLMAEYMQAKTSGADRSPFSSKNLPHKKYQINEGDLALYKEITSRIDKADILVISKLTRLFIHEIMAKSKAYKGKDIKKLMKQEMLKGKEFIHSQGLWDEYLAFLQQNIKQKGE